MFGIKSIPESQLATFLRKRQAIEERYHNDLFSLIQEQKDPSDAMQTLLNLTAILARDHQSQSCLLRKLVERLEQTEESLSLEDLDVDYIGRSSGLLNKLQKSQTKVDDFNVKHNGSKSYKNVQQRKMLERRLRQNLVAFEENRLLHLNRQEKMNEMLADRQSAVISCLSSIGQRLELISRNLVSTSTTFNRAITEIKPPPKLISEIIEPVYLLKNGLLLKDLLISVPLSHTTPNSSTLPPFLCHAFKQLERRGRVEGIYRIPSSISAREQSLLSLESDFENFDWEGCDVHVLAGLVKMYFRELPEVIFSFENVERCLYSIIEDDSERIMILKQKVNELKELERLVLMKLVKHLQIMASFEEDTKMGVENLSLLFSTLIFDKNLAISPDCLATSPTTTAPSSFNLFKKFGGTSRDCESPTSTGLKFDFVLQDLITHVDEVFEAAPRTVESDNDSNCSLGITSAAETDYSKSTKSSVLSVKPSFNLKRMFSIKSFKGRTAKS